MLHYNVVRLFIFSSIVFLQSATAQTYAPAVGVAGTTAMYKDSTAFTGWASGCTVNRGYQDISNTSMGPASAGEATMVPGAADNAIVSLGDGGTATCTFPFSITNGAGPDFAVFENGFDDTFLELAFVDVSSDGVHFFRFPSHSLTDTVMQTSSFGPTTATKLNNFAGKYRGGYGTPFDLQELAATPGLNVNAVTHVKITDVVGSVNNLYATRDSHGNKVNDPWPTAFASGGFDLDAIGVIHDNRVVGIQENSLAGSIHVYPNPASQQDLIKVTAPYAISAVSVIDFSGKCILTSADDTIDASQLSPGIYLLSITTAKGILIKKTGIQ